MRSVFVTHGEGETIELGSALAAGLRAGDVLAIEGELGAGKTRLIRGIATALGVAGEHVASPTYVIAHEYRANPSASLPAPATAIETVHHVDAYRLSGADELDTIGWDRISDPTAAVLLVEWPSRVASALTGFAPDRVGRITIEPVDGESERRRITLVAPPSWDERTEFEALFSWAIGRGSAGVRLVGGKLPAGWTRCPTTGRAVSPGNPSFPFADARARDADLNKWFTGAYTISRELTPDDADDPDLTTLSED